MAHSRSKRPRKQRGLPPLNKVKDNAKEKALRSVSVEVQAKPAIPRKTTPTPHRNPQHAQKAPLNSVQDSRKEEVVDTVVPVAPHMQCCIVGPCSTKQAGAAGVCGSACDGATATGHSDGHCESMCSSPAGYRDHDTPQSSTA